MSNEPKWKWNSQYFINPKNEQVHPVWAADQLNALEAEVNEWKSQCNLADIHITDLKEELERLKKVNQSIANDWLEACKQSENWQGKYHEISRTYHTVASERDTLQSDLDRCKAERLGAEGFRELINKRIAEFNSIHHTYEGVKLQEAMDVILRLVPPSAFRASQLNADQTQEGKG